MLDYYKYTNIICHRNDINQNIINICISNVSYNSNLHKLICAHVSCNVVYIADWSNIGWVCLSDLIH